MSNIQCTTLEDFIQVCSGLVREGILFTADAETLTISTTGGY